MANKPSCCMDTCISSEHEFPSSNVPTICDRIFGSLVLVMHELHVPFCKKVS